MSLLRFALISALLLVANVTIGQAQAPASGGPVDQALIDDLVTASRILADQGVLDAYGHVSIRHPANPNRYLIARAMSPADVTAADIMEFDLDSNPVDRRGRIAVSGSAMGSSCSIGTNSRAMTKTKIPIMEKILASF